MSQNSISSKQSIAITLNTNIRDIIMAVLVLWLESPYQNFMNFYIYGLLWIAWIVLAFVSNQRAFWRMLKRKGVGSVFLWIIASTVLAILGRENFSMALYTYPFVMISLLYYIEAKEIQTIKGFIYLYVCYAIVIALGSIIALRQNPLISRDLASSDKEFTSKFATPFIANFCTVNNLPYVCTVIVFFLKEHLLLRRERIIAILLLFLDVILLFMAKYVISIITFFVMIILTLVFGNTRKDKKIILVIIGLCIFLLAFLLKEQIVQLLLNITKEGALHDRLTELSLYFSANQIDSGSDINLRIIKYTTSIKTFFQNPLLGVGAKAYRADGLAGGHSQFLDAYAYYGIFIGSIFIYSYYGIYKAYWRRLSKQYRRLFSIIFGAYFVNNILNLCYAPEMLFCIYFIVPFVLLLVQSRQCYFEELLGEYEIFTYNDKQ